MRESEGESGSWRSDRKARDREGVIERESESVRAWARGGVEFVVSSYQESPPHRNAGIPPHLHVTFRL